ncbi:FecCD family ABC transporter permease [Gloeocapsopsis dulcis]|uniref:Iron ABC transporter permease n=1 Tax=Gloeocapsopsis dulcis AAB1 = 1H9 TaxID=1433147 RepID=A0A6N8G0F9_9CHRO|nr:iron ABC transporter permease [Gloeocapsopsis dulcis]MUL38870.1 iron ABC transporter permease [Gloeocapsopsis dulcis AAB1 = 1H9]WNN89301.1 iron ABC transporter permease [Gloeocapsopsis dulcis]
MKQNTFQFRSRSLPLSLRVKQRVLTVLLLLLLVTLVAMIASVAHGEYPIPPLAVIQTVLGLAENSDYAFVINTLRLPRTLVASLVGLALAISGAIMQGITRNPLADPGIIGVNAGASLAAVSLIVLFPNVPVGFLPLSAFAGALAVSLLIYFLAWEGGSSPLRLILIGVGIATVIGACTSVLITFGEINSVSQALVWLAGSVYGRSWEQVFAFLPWLAVFMPFALVKTRQLNALALGDDLATGLGCHVEWQRGWLLLISTALAGAAVATAGAIGFVGLMAPHMARQLVGSTHGSLVPVAGMMGAMIVVVADLLGRTLFAPIEIPCGIVTAVIGAPYFMYLLVQKRNQ